MRHNRAVSVVLEIVLLYAFNSIVTTGMIRSSVESVSSSGQFTPAIRQFSAPKAVRGDVEESDFGKPLRVKVERIDDDDDVRESGGRYGDSRDKGNTRKQQYVNICMCENVICTYV